MQISSAVSGVDLGSAISVAVARKALESERAQGDQLVRLIRDAATAQDRAQIQSQDQAQRAQAAARRGGVDVLA